MAGWRASPWQMLFYTKVVCSRRRCLRLFGIAALTLTYLKSTWAQWGGSPRGSRALLLALLAAAGAAALLAPRLLVAAVAAGAAALVLVPAMDREDHTGHRAGAEGFSGPVCENTVEAAAALLARDAAEGPLQHFPYLEFDVQECADGELVVFHDALLSRAFPMEGANAAAAKAIERQTGVPFALLRAQDLTLEQLKSLHLGGRQGLCLPTLRQMLEACIAGGVRRSLAIEMKQITSDQGRHKFIDTISWYLATQGPRLEADPLARRLRCRRLGWAGVIAFPHLWAHSFGPFGSPEWRRWAAEFRARGIPVRACHTTWLTLVGAGPPTQWPWQPLALAVLVTAGAVGGWWAL